MITESNDVEDFLERDAHECWRLQRTYAIVVGQVDLENSGRLHLMIVCLV